MASVVTWYFEGEFKNGKQTKKGKYFWKDGTEYIEEKKKGLTITKEMLGESSEDEEIVEFSDKEKELSLVLDNYIKKESALY